MARARAAIARQAAPLELADTPYPGFEGRPPARDFESFLDQTQAALPAAPPGSLFYGTGVGALVLLALRARGLLLETPILLQAPVLWGLTTRRLPGLMRRAPRGALHAAFRPPFVQRWFERRYFLSSLARDESAAFFAGYTACTALPDLFRWVTPAVLQRVAGELAGPPRRLERISVWWGDLDRVVREDELRVTERVLDVRWPVVRFPAWGHYPMIDDPEGWIRELGARSAEIGV